MKFFFPDSQDLVDPSFDFEAERRSPDRVRHRDDLYAHEVFAEHPYDGLLVSKGIVDGFGESGSRYSIAQRHRLLRGGAPEFFRVSRLPAGPIPIMGDCGAFTYVREDVPPYSTAEVIQFYLDCRFDLGISPDHVILAFDRTWDHLLTGIGEIPGEIRRRQQITLELAAQFLSEHQHSGLRFLPLGVAQGWSPQSYASAVDALQKMGYHYVAVGGLVPLKSPDILASLEAVNVVRRPDTRLHLLGVTRTDHISRFADFGVASFDSTSPLRQAFKDEKDNYYTMERTYSAVRVPQVEGNARLLSQIKSGAVKQEDARRLESAALLALRDYDSGRACLDSVLAVLQEYEELYDPGRSHVDIYREVLEAQPWKACECDVCRKIGYHVILFRGAERNRRRGFHNLWVFFRRLRRELDRLAPADHTLAATYSGAIR